jgi:regulator of extracellular matrix RemA (YlzA/DUF370 family)
MILRQENMYILVVILLLAVCKTMHPNRRAGEGLGVSQAWSCLKCAPVAQRACAHFAQLVATTYKRITLAKILTKTKVIHVSQIQHDTLKKDAKYNVDVGDFIRTAIAEKNKKKRIQG